MINKIWIYMAIIGLSYMMLKNETIELNKLLISLPNDTLTLFLTFAPLIIFWNGIMQIAKDSNLLNFISKILSPFVNFLFKSEKKETKEYISANIAANMLGLGAAATPMGLMAFKKMQDDNSNKNKSTKSMITLLLINTSGLTIIPSYIISIRHANNALINFEIVHLILIATLITTTFAIILTKVVNK